MSTFQKLESKGKDSGLNDVLFGKFKTLLSDESEVGIKPCVELLRSFGDEGLCVVLHEENGQVALREDLGIVHRLLWMVEVVSVITEEGSIWKPLYYSGAFDDMEVQVLGNVEWRNLSEIQQKKVVSFSISGVDVPAGTFMMGALPDDEEAEDREKLQHEVTLTRGIRVSKYICTQGLYELVMGENPSHFKGSIRPVDKVSWCDAVSFCNKLSEMEGLEPVYVLPEPFEHDDDWSMKVTWNKEAKGYRLPTEAEWEYCARGGESYLYAGSDNIDDVAWHKGNSGNETHLVGQKKANEYGLYDMSGNVWEWVWDSWLRKYDSSTTEPIYVDVSGSKHVRRGGSWDEYAAGTRISYRDRDIASFRLNDLGFRFLRILGG